MCANFLRELPERNDREVSAKRRRLSVEEVEEGLRAVGLAQPVLRLLCGGSGSDRGAAHAMKRGLDFQDPDARKRRRFIPEQTALVRAPSQATHFLAPIVHNCGIDHSFRFWGGMCYQDPVKDPSMPFHVNDQGFLLAELPPESRSLIGGSANPPFLAVAGIVIDSNCNAYLISEKGELLAVVLPVSCLEDQCPEDVLLQLPNQMSTRVPYSPVEQATGFYFSSSQLATSMSTKVPYRPPSIFPNYSVKNIGAVDVEMSC